MKECEFFVISEEGNLICKKIHRYNEITKEMCKEHCPVYEKKCMHLVFSLRKNEVFSALGIGGRRTEIKIEKAVCSKLKEPIFNIKKCFTCPDFTEKKEEFKEENDIVKVGLDVLIKNIGSEKTKEFLEAIRGKKEELSLEKEIENWLSLE